MNYNVLTPRVVGIFSTSGANIGFIDRLSATNGIPDLFHLPRAKGTIAFFDPSIAHCTEERDGVAVVLLGRPRVPESETLGAGSTYASPAWALDTYLKEGDSLVKHLNGSFTLILSDARSDSTLLLASDRFGIRPLYIFRPTADSTIFSSELDLLAQAVTPKPSLSAQALFDYTYFHAVPSPLTIYNGIERLPAAHSLTVTRDGHTTGRYWLPDFQSASSASESALADELMATLRQSVAACSSSESVAGAFLSGGLDSSTVCGLLSEMREEPTPAVSVGFDVEGYDEIAFAKAAAERFRLKHIVHYMTPEEVANSIPRLAQAYPEPFGNSSVVPAYLCALAAKANGIDLLLAGDAGDELFAGNERYAKQSVFEHYYRIPGPIRRFLLEPMLAGDSSYVGIGPLRKLHRYIVQAKIPLPARLQTYNLLEMRPVDEIFSESVLEIVDAQHPAELMNREYHAVEADTLSRMLFYDWRFTLADNDLRKVTGACELAGVEVAFPFLDNEVVEFSTRIPSELKLKGNQLRYFYKKALTGYLPDTVINKSKHGFGLPFGEWLLADSRLQEMVYDALTTLAGRGLFRKSFIDALITDHREQHAAFYGNMVWVLAMLEWWLEAHANDYRFVAADL